MKVFKKILVFALAILLATNGLSVKVEASACNSKYTEAFEKCADKDMKAEIAKIMDKIAGEYEKCDCVDKEKATMITFNGSPVKVVKYDGKQHGLSADVRQVVSGNKVAKPIIWYVGVTADKEIYHSLNAPTEVGYYNVVVVYPGSCEWYPCVAYGIVVILPVCEKPECPNKPECPGCPEWPEKPDCPGGNEPGGNEPGGNEPGGNEPGGNEPGGNEPGGNEPGGNEPGGNEPGGNEPGGNEPDGNEPDEKEPVEKDDVEIVPVEKEDASPKTGDSANVVLYGVSLAAALAAIVAVLRKRNA